MKRCIWGEKGLPACQVGIRDRRYWCPSCNAKCPEAPTAEAVEALKALLAELPAEFSTEPQFEDQHRRQSFQVIKKSNVRKVHFALWELQEYFKDTE